jgi:hypothetical protein
VAGLVGARGRSFHPDADLPPVAFHGLRWASTTRAKDQSPPFDPMAARTVAITPTWRRGDQVRWKDRAGVYSAARSATACMPKLP